MDKAEEELRKKAIELERAIASETKAMERAALRKKQLEEAVKEKKEIEKEIPSEDDIEKNIKKSGKGLFEDNTYHKELRKKKTVVIWIVINLFILSVLFFSELFWGSFVSDPNIQGSFILDTCHLPRFSDCSMEIYADNAIFTFEPRERIIQSIDTSHCQNYSILPNNTIMLYNCSFSSVANDLDLIIEYKNTPSGLTNREHVKVIKYFEITTLKYITNKGINSISSGITGFMSRTDSPKNNKTYK